ncbi:MAG: sigma 54-interacting transcriptional regulator, partial [Desulfocapsaceae bacterium]|nr:sigma 54-interacting transcriptional regulator [Desulfocapsaceae bacterium]
MRNLSSSYQAEALGHSELFLDFQERLSRVAPVDRPVLLMGERGTGKELAAQRLHFLSRRWDGPFVTLNCSTLSPSLIESELFGHERGAFTGAEKSRIGRFEAPHGGTLFLDEIGSMPQSIQGKLLRALQEKEIRKVG